MLPSLRGREQVCDEARHSGGDATRGGECAARGENVSYSLKQFEKMIEKEINQADIQSCRGRR